jgi:hypothetical protein
VTVVKLELAVEKTRALRLCCTDCDIERLGGAEFEKGPRAINGRP